MCCYMMCRSVYSITTVWALCRSCRPPLSWSVCPNNVAIICHLPPGVLVRPLSGCWLSSSLLVCSTIRALGLCISCVGVFLCFLLYIMLQIKTVVFVSHTWYAMALGDFHSRIQSPTVAMHLILFHYNSSEWLVLPLFFPVRKFLQLPVQVPMGSLTRPVTGYDAHDDAGHDQHC